MGVWGYAWPVSYTHLDVYKRQAVGDYLLRSVFEQLPAERQEQLLALGVAQQLSGCLLYTSGRARAGWSPSIWRRCWSPAPTPICAARRR